MGPAKIDGFSPNPYSKRSKLAVEESSHYSRPKEGQVSWLFNDEERRHCAAA